MRKAILITCGSGFLGSHFSERLPLPEDDPSQRKPDSTLARNELGWEPTVKLKDGLKKTIEYFEGYLKGNQITALGHQFMMRIKGLI